ncbi:MAG: GNAT family N-acetyltransferase [Phycisphaerales bacterium]|nr:GNAT family N-acetyltransferase [Phycisphaerales bacterium]
MNRQAFDSTGNAPAAPSVPDPAPPAARLGAVQSDAELSPELQIRPALPGDHVPLQFFFDTTLRRDYFMRRGQLRDMLRGGRHRVWVAELAGVLVGVAITTARARLVNLLVHPACRGIGLARALVRAASPVDARVKTDGSAGDPRGFFRSLGFVSAGATPHKPHIELMVAAPSARTAAAPAALSTNRKEQP